jgi:hypothetical protein
LGVGGRSIGNVKAVIRAINLTELANLPLVSQLRKAIKQGNESDFTEAAKALWRVMKPSIEAEKVKAYHAWTKTGASLLALAKELRQARTRSDRLDSLMDFIAIEGRMMFQIMKIFKEHIKVQEKGPSLTPEGLRLLFRLVQIFHSALKNVVMTDEGVMSVLPPIPSMEHLSSLPEAHVLLVLKQMVQGAILHSSRAVSYHVDPKGGGMFAVGTDPQVRECNLFYLGNRTLEGQLVVNTEEGHRVVPYPTTQNRDAEFYRILTQHGNRLVRRIPLGNHHHAVRILFNQDRPDPTRWFPVFDGERAMNTIALFEKDSNGREGVLYGWNGPHEMTVFEKVPTSLLEDEDALRLLRILHSNTLLRNAERLAGHRTRNEDASVGRLGRRLRIHKKPGGSPPAEETK